MAGRKPQVDPCKVALLAELRAATNLAAAIQAIPSSVSTGAAPTIHPKYKVQVVELAFMGVVAAWEEFLEATLVRYIAGAESKSGYKPTPKYGLATNIGHAYQVVSGRSKFNPSSDYLKASDPSWVMSKAEFVFYAHPYKSLTARLDLLESANKVRNRVAHSSKKCRDEFKVVALHYLGRPAAGKLRHGYTAGDLLLEPTTAKFTEPHPAGSNHFQAFVHVYTTLANLIVP